MRTSTSILLVLLFSFGLISCKQPSPEARNEAIKTAMLKALKWQEANPIHNEAPTDWTYGAYFTGVAKAHQATQDESYLKALTEMADRNSWQPFKRFHHADDVVICYPYVYLASIDADGVNLAPTDSVLYDHLYKSHPWKEGTDGEMKQILWWWCDALFMTPPVLTAYARLKNKPAYLDEMHKYYMETYNLLYDKEENLFARDIRFVWKGDSTDLKAENGEKIFWSRGNGWVMGGLALMLEDLPLDYEHRPFYENLFKEMANKIKDIHPEDGLWRTSLLDLDAYPHGEMSGSGFHTYALAWGINNGLLPAEEYKPVVLKAWEAIEACQHESGKVGWVQNIGYDPKPADADSWQNFGTGAFLLAGSELLKLK